MTRDGLMKPGTVMDDHECLTLALEMLDAYAGPEAERIHWLANQWTSYFDDPGEAEWEALEAEASRVIARWLSIRELRSAAA